MNSTLSNALIFATGAAIGSVVTMYFLKTKYERLVQEEIDSVKEAFVRGFGKDNESEPDDTAETPDEEPEPGSELTDGYLQMVKELGYHKYSDVEKDNPEETSIPGNPRVITPDELGEMGYNIIDLTYWADGVLTDGKNKVIQDVDALIGKGTLERFGEYEEDALHVRDDVKKVEFEILRDLKKYSDFFDDSPHQAEVE